MVWPFASQVNPGHVGTEQEPLLGESGSQEDASQDRDGSIVVPATSTAAASTSTPIPWRQILIILAMRTSEPICICVILPFINEMILSVGQTDDPAKVGYYSGLIEGLFSLAQFLTVLTWASLSDRFGRRPMLLTGLFGMSIFTSLFGLSRSFTMIVILRFLAGMMNGNVAVMKSAIGEITDSTNQARAFSLFPLCWTLGSVVSPLLAAFLAKPVERFPNTIGKLELFRAFPYLLPCLVASCFCLTALLVGLFFFEETLPVHSDKLSRRRRRFLSKSMSWIPGMSLRYRRRSPSTSSAHSYASTVSIEANGSATVDGGITSTTPTSSLSAQKSPSIRSLLKDAWVFPMLVSYSFMAFVALALDMVLVQWLFTPLESGGVGFSLAEIGTTLACSGFMSTVVMLLFFPPLQKRFGTLAVFRCGLSCYPLAILLFPVTQYLARSSDGPVVIIVDRPHNIWIWVGVGGIILISRVGSLAFGANMMLVNISSPSDQLLGTVNGLAQMVGSLSRCIGPILSTSLFAASISRNLLGGNLIWVVLCILGTCGVVASMFVKDGKREGRR